MNILILEDHPDLRASLSTILEYHGYTVYSVANGLEGMQLMMDEAVPDIIISDLKMPYMDGLDFFKAIHQNTAWKHIPFVLLTGQSDILNPEIPTTVDNILTKPISIESLIALLGELGGSIHAAT